MRLIEPNLDDTQAHEAFKKAKQCLDMGSPMPEVLSQYPSIKFERTYIPSSITQTGLGIKGFNLQHIIELQNSIFTFDEAWGQETLADRYNNLVGDNLYNEALTRYPDLTPFIDDKETTPSTPHDTNLTPLFDLFYKLYDTDQLSNCIAEFSKENVKKMRRGSLNNMFSGLIEKHGIKSCIWLIGFLSQKYQNSPTMSFDNYLRLYKRFAIFNNLFKNKTYSPKDRLDFIRQWQSKLDSKNATARWIQTLLTNPTDDTPDNFMLVPVLTKSGDLAYFYIMHIDQDNSLGHQITCSHNYNSQRKEHYSSLISIFAIDQHFLNLPSSSTITKYFLSKTPFEWLINLCETLREDEKKFDDMLTSGIFTQADLYDEEGSTIELAFKFMPGMLTRIAAGINRLQQLFRGEITDIVEGNPLRATHQQIFVHFHSILAAFHQGIIEEASDSFEALTRIRNGGDFSIEQVLEDDSPAKLHDILQKEEYNYRPGGCERLRTHSLAQATQELESLIDLEALPINACFDVLKRLHALGVRDVSIDEKKLTELLFIALGNADPEMIALFLSSGASMITDSNGTAFNQLCTFYSDPRITFETLMQLTEIIVTHKDSQLNRSSLEREPAIFDLVRDFIGSLNAQIRRGAKEDTRGRLPYAEVKERGIAIIKLAQNFGLDVNTPRNAEFQGQETLLDYLIYETSLKLSEAAGKPELLTIVSEHYGQLILDLIKLGANASCHKHRTMRFFEDNKTNKYLLESYELLCVMKPSIAWAVVTRHITKKGTEDPHTSSDDSMASTILQQSLSEELAGHGSVRQSNKTLVKLDSSLLPSLQEAIDKPSPSGLKQQQYGNGGVFCLNLQSAGLNYLPLSTIDIRPYASDGAKAAFSHYNASTFFNFIYGEYPFGCAPSSQLYKYNSGKTITACLLSSTVEGDNLQAVLDNTPELLDNLDPYHFTKLFLLLLIMKHDDLTPNKLILKKLSNGSYCLIPADGESAFSHLKKKNYRDSLDNSEPLVTSCFPFLLNIMETVSMSELAIMQFCQRDFSALMETWIQDISQQESAYTILFGNKESINELVSQSPTHLLGQLHKLQRILRKHLDSGTAPSFFKVLASMSPYESAQYRRAFLAAPTPQGRFSQLVENRGKSGGADDANTPRLLISKEQLKKPFSAKNMISELKALSDEQRRLDAVILEIHKGKTALFQALKFDESIEFVINQVDFSKVDETTQELIFDHIINKRPTCFKILKITNCSVINDLILQAILSHSRQLESLTLNRCHNIKGDFITHLPALCRGINELVLTRLNAMTSYSPEERCPTLLALPNLSRLELQHLPLLKNIFITSETLQDLIILECPEFDIKSYYRLIENLMQAGAFHRAWLPPRQLKNVLISPAKILQTRIIECRYYKAYFKYFIVGESLDLADLPITDHDIQYLIENASPEIIARVKKINLKGCFISPHRITELLHAFSNVSVVILNHIVDDNQLTKEEKPSTKLTATRIQAMPSGHLIALGNQGQLKLLEPGTRSSCDFFDDRYSKFTAFVVNNNGLLIGRTQNNTIELWDIFSSTLKTSYTPKGGYEIKAIYLHSDHELYFLLDNKLLAHCSISHQTSNFKDLKLWQVSHGTQIIHLDEDRIVVAGDKASLNVYNQTGELLHKFQDSQLANIECIQCIHSKVIVTGHAYGRINFWQWSEEDATFKHSAPKEDWRHQSKITDIIRLPYQRFATCSLDGDVKIWSEQTLSVIATIHCDAEIASLVATDAGITAVYQDGQISNIALSTTFNLDINELREICQHYMMAPLGKNLCLIPKSSDTQEFPLLQEQIDRLIGLLKFMTGIGGVQQKKGHAKHCIWLTPTREFTHDMIHSFWRQLSRHSRQQQTQELQTSELYLMGLPIVSDHVAKICSHFPNLEHVLVDLYDLNHACLLISELLRKAHLKTVTVSFNNSRILSRSGPSATFFSKDTTAPGLSSSSSSNSASPSSSASPPSSALSLKWSSLPDDLNKKLTLGFHQKLPGGITVESIGRDGLCVSYDNRSPANQGKQQAWLSCKQFLAGVFNHYKIKIESASNKIFIYNIPQASLSHFSSLIDQIFCLYRPLQLSAEFSGSSRATVKAAIRERTRKPGDRLIRAPKASSAFLSPTQLRRSSRKTQGSETGLLSRRSTRGARKANSIVGAGSDTHPKPNNSPGASPPDGSNSSSSPSK